VVPPECSTWSENDASLYWDAAVIALMLSMGKPQYGNNAA